MKLINSSQPSLQQVGVEGTLMALAPVPFLLASTNISNSIPPIWRLIVASVAAVSCLVCAFTLYRRPRIGKFFGWLSLTTSFITAIPYFVSDPFATLLGSVATISVGYALVDFKLNVDNKKQSSHADRSLQRVRSAAITMPVILGSLMILGQPEYLISQGAIAVSAVLGQTLFVHWVWNSRPKKFSIILTLLGLMLSFLFVISLQIGHTRIVALIASLLTILILPRSTPTQERREHWWETLLNHPARILLSTFLALCFLGVLLLIIPNATSRGEISLVDAAFTSVSAVCVTGLIVLDTPIAFTLLGQSFILLLIQLGGLGIMSITTVALHAMGRRISLRHEHLLTTMTDTDQKDLVISLITILKFTFIAEGLGALILVGLFYSSGDYFCQAVWRGSFTAISAFCNAGFALQSNSLIPYQGSPLILHTVAILIVFGGMAPATSLVLPKWITRQQIPIAARITLITTTALLISGMLFMLVFEWDGVFSGMSLADKIHNAWFQSVTLRTAGFNSVEIAGVVSPTFFVMLCFMFIGGSPGGTAGGVKTTTLGVLAMTFWANITNRNDVIIQNRRVPSGTIYRAITIVASGAFVWFLIVLMLEVTQQISARDIIFETTSALGTVGLSTGATAYLDEIGKVIIMIAMFAGRIGPITLFMLLSEDHSVTVSRCPDAKIIFT